MRRFPGCSRRAWPAGCAFLLGFLMLGCAAPRGGLSPGTPDGPGGAWIPAARLRAAVPEPGDVVVPPDLAAGAWGLPEAVRVALLNSSSTRVSFLAASSADAQREARVASTRPKLTGQASLTVRDSAGVAVGDEVTITPALSLSWLVLDFGRGAASVEETARLLLAANWSHNAAIADVVLATARAYYAHGAARAALAAREANLSSAVTASRAAEARMEAGTATALDTLQARAGVARAQLALETAAGLVRTTRGALFATMGLPALEDHPLADEEPRPDLSLADRGVDEWIREALAARSDLAAAGESVAAAEAALRAARLAAMPTVTLSASAGVTGSLAKGESADLSNAESASLQLSVPLLTGGAQAAAERRAQLDLRMANERRRGLENQVVAQVFSSWQALRTAGARIAAAGDFLAAAKQAEQVALGRYVEGVGTIVEVTGAQAELAAARLEESDARWEWFRALATLSHDAGAGPGD